jgi:hypothetical protein
MKNSKIAKEVKNKTFFSSQGEIARKQLALTYVDLTR